ncbi:MAG: hypothetical protein AAB956_03950 [Patescibacteria group bacterium]
MLIDKRDSGRTEETKLHDCIGVHVICGGDVHIHPVSLTHKAIICLNCQLRIVVLTEIATYADLREFLNEGERVDIQLVPAMTDNEA